jgi:dCMP deaminase
MYNDKMVNKWHRRFYQLAQHVSEWSKDPSTQVGACVVNDSKQVLSLGFNGFPRGVEDIAERYQDKETKYKFVSHAERNALDNAYMDIKGATLYCTLFPCNECAKGIIQKGITTVVTTRPDLNRTHNNLEESLQMFNEAGVEIIFVENL